MATTPSPQPPPTKEERRQSVRGHILFAIAVLLLLSLAYHLAKELEILYVAVVLCVVLMPIVDAITHLNLRGYHPSRTIAIIILIALVGAGITLFLLVGLPPVLRDLRNFMTEFPRHVTDTVVRLRKVPFADKLGIATLAQHAQSDFAATAGYLISSLPNWLSHIFDILTTAFLSIYFMLEGEQAYRFFLSLFRYDQRTRLDATLRKANLKMSKWLFGQGLLMLILGVSSTVVFGFLHVRYFVLLGVLMGLLNIVPIAGGVITICLAAGVAALDSFAKMGGVLLFYAIYINVENAVLTPRIMRSSVNLMGLTVLVSLLLGTALAGIVGALVAVPTAALVSVLLEEYAVQQP